MLKQLKTALENAKIALEEAFTISFTIYVVKENCESEDGRFYEEDEDGQHEEGDDFEEMSHD